MSEALPAGKGLGPDHGAGSGLLALPALTSPGRQALARLEVVVVAWLCTH